MTDTNQAYIVPSTAPPVPTAMLQACNNLALFADYFFVNGSSFLLTSTETLGFLSVTYCERTGGAEAVNILKNVQQIHERRGFHATTVHGDNDFKTKKLTEGLPSLIFHSCAADQHVGEAERPIRSIKERSRCITHDVPFNIFTKLMTKELILFIVDQLNSFPSGTASHLIEDSSPNGIVLGYPRPDLSLPFTTFGSYCMVYVGTTNTQKSRAVSAIALRPSNLSGGYYFQSLYSGKRLHAYHWKELPVDAEIIDRVHELAINERQPSSVNSELLFEWTPGVPLDDPQGATYLHNETNHESNDDTICESHPDNTNNTDNDPQHTYEGDEFNETNKNETNENNENENENNEHERNENERNENEQTENNQFEYDKS